MRLPHRLGEDEIHEAVAQSLDPVRRQEMARDRIQQNYAAHRQGIEDGIRRREEASRGDDEDDLAPLPVPDAWIRADGSLRYLSAAEKAAEQERINKMAERGR